jgi:hypothetical protein
MDNDERIVRLVSDGSGASGGALPLPDAFAAVLRQLLENGTASYGLLAKKITDAPLIKMKKNRILKIWGTWDNFCEDIIAVLDEGGFIRTEDQQGLYRALGRNFREGVSLEVISSGEVVKATGGVAGAPVTVTVFGRNIHEERNEISKAVMAVNRCKGELSRMDKIDMVIQNHFYGIIAQLEGDSDPRPPKPQGDPEVLVRCHNFNGNPTCGRLLPQTEANFVLYWSRDKWYWRPKCRDCAMPPGHREFQEKLIRAVNSLLEDGRGVFPGKGSVAKEVARRMGFKGDHSSVYQSWDRLAARGLLPPRP